MARCESDATVLAWWWSARATPHGGLMMILATMIAIECEAERYEWAAFWRDEARYLFGADGEGQAP